MTDENDTFPADDAWSDGQDDENDDEQSFRERVEEIREERARDRDENDYSPRTRFDDAAMADESQHGLVAERGNPGANEAQWTVRRVGSGGR